MDNKILGIHHITAIASDPNKNLAFYSKILGLRLVKKTVNFDDPSTYHFYFGNETGMPGTILTFFPWGKIPQGRTGSGMATDIGYSVPVDSLEFWKNRFDEFGVTHGQLEEKFGETYLSFQDPDGLKLDLIESNTPDQRKPWETADINANVATKGFHNVTLTLRKVAPTASILTDIFGYRLLKQEGNRYRFITDAVENASIVDILEEPNLAPGRNSAGTNHHVAFRVANDDILMEYREKVAGKGLHITPKIDRDYFYSLYFREPGGVLFEIATDNPGFDRDETVAELGTHLMLPTQYEPSRERIAKNLPILNPVV